MLTTKFFGTSFFSTFVLASVLTPEFTTGLSILIAAIFVGLLNLYTARTARMVALREMAKVVAPIQTKVDELVPVVDKVYAHVNSEKTKDAGIIASQLIQLEMKDKVISDLRDAAATLAQAKAVAEMVRAVSEAAIAGAAIPATAKVPESPAQNSITLTDASTTRIAEATERGADAHERAATAQVDASKIQRTAADTQERAAEINKQSDK